jgi:signal transduction histidine kinase/DNA-binding response OmpR family regulator
LTDLTLPGTLPEPAGERPAVLIVDDLPEKLLVLQTVLDGLDTDLVLAHSGGEALREMLKREFAVVLLDVNMPDIDGFETASLIRSYRQTAHTPIIFVTAYVDEMQAAQGYSLGAVDYIVAPVVPDILRTKVRVFLDLFAAQRRMREQAEQRLALFAAQAARDAAEANARRLAFLTQVGRVLGGSLEEGAALCPLLQLMQRELGGITALALCDPDGAQPPRVHVVGVTLPLEDDDGTGPPDAHAIDTLPAPLSEPLGAAFERGQRVELDAPALELLQELLTRDPRDAARPTLQAACAWPLQVGARVHGVLLVAVPQTTPAWAALDEATQRLAMALENARLVRDWQQEIVERRAAEQRMKESNRRKDEFLAMLSHELRNPLAPIRNAAEVVRLAGGRDPKLEWASAVMGRQVDHLRRLIDELLDVARISQGKVTLQVETLDLRTVVQQGVETVKPLLDARRQALQVSLPEQRVWLRGDAARLTQVVGNLLTNAAKYSDEGGQITLGLTTAAGQAELRVRDNGIGIEPDLLPRIFDLFEQGRRGLDRAQGGLGVGLTLAQRLVGMHQGTIAAASAGAGQGAEFVVHLPCLADVALRDVPPAADVTAAPPRSCRVLVVDDNRDAAESIAIVLDLAGHDVHTAGDGTEALGLAAIYAPEVVVLDLGLPGIDGYEVATRLRDLPGLQDAMLIALTGYGSDRDRERTAATGFDMHLVKPADPQRIARAIEQRIRESEAADDDTAATTAQASPPK